MEELNQQPQFYSLEPEPTPSVPWFKQRKLWIIIGGGGVAIVFTILLAIFSINLLHGTKNSTVTAETAACKDLSDAAFVSCISLAASTNRDQNICTVLTADDRTACTDGVNLLLALSSKDYRECEKVTDVISHLSCQAEIRNAAVAADDCAFYHVGQEACDAQRALQEIIASGDPTNCGSLSGTAVASCEDLFSSLDDDADGLTLDEEFQNGTDPQNPDTDGDGYTDGQEVSSGHDPLKP